MKKITTFLVCLAVFLVSNFCFAQVGIGTNNPKGILDVESNEHGIVYPSVALTASNVELPVINPQGGSIAVGTTIYNTNTTNTGSFDVEPGIYSWDGSRWITHFYVRQFRFYEQNAVLRPSSILGWEDVPNLGALSGNNFTAKYSGVYKININVNYGGGEVVDSTNVNTVQAKGDFRFTFNTPTPIVELIDIKSYSTYNTHVGSGTQFSNTWIQTDKTIYVDLVGGQTYTFNLQFNQDPGNGFKGDGNLVGLDDGRGYVGADIPCRIEISYIDEI